MSDDEQFDSTELTLEELEYVVGGQSPESEREYKTKLVNDYLASIKHQLQEG